MTVRELREILEKVNNQESLVEVIETDNKFSYPKVITEFPNKLQIKVSLVYRTGDSAPDIEYRRINVSNS